MMTFLGELSRNIKNLVEKFGGKKVVPMETVNMEENRSYLVEYMRHVYRKTEKKSRTRNLLVTKGYKIFPRIIFLPVIPFLVQI